MLAERVRIEPSISDWTRRRRDIRSAFPDDLLEDIKEDEPALYNEAMLCDAKIADYRRHQNEDSMPDEFDFEDQTSELKSSVSPIALLPSILTNGWNRPKRNKFSKNWADMENLLKLYAIGLYFRGKELTPQALYDKEELTKAVQVASISPRHKKGIPALKRLEKAKTYLRFGMRTLDADFHSDLGHRKWALYDLDREINEETNEHNVTKLIKSKGMALHVGRFIRDRYRTE